MSLSMKSTQANDFYDENVVFMIFNDTQSRT